MKNIRMLLGLIVLVMFPMSSQAETVGVATALKGRILVTVRQLTPLATDSETVAAYKAAHLTSVTGQRVDNILQWQFFTKSFLTMSLPSGSNFVMLFKPRSTFSSVPVSPVQYSLLSMPIEPGSVLNKEVRISGSDGIRAGVIYDISLVYDASGKRTTVATAVLTFK